MSELWVDAVGSNVFVVLINGEKLKGVLQQVGKKQIIITDERGRTYYVTLANILYYYKV